MEIGRTLTELEREPRTHAWNAFGQASSDAASRVGEAVSSAYEASSGLRRAPSTRLLRELRYSAILAPNGADTIADAST
jgi:hypothetical protein